MSKYLFAIVLISMTVLIISVTRKKNAVILVSGIVFSSIIIFIILLGIALK